MVRSTADSQSSGGGHGDTTLNVPRHTRRDHLEFLVEFTVQPFARIAAFLAEDERRRTVLVKHFLTSQRQNPSYIPGRST